MRRRIPNHAFLALWSLMLGSLLPVPARAGLREQAAVQELRAALGPSAVVVTDPERSQAIALRGLAVPLAGGRTTPGPAAARWMLEHAESFGLRPGRDGIRVRGVEHRSGGLTRVTLEQEWGGLPVVGAESRALVDAHGVLVGLASGVRPDLELGTTPSVLPGEAIATAATALGLRLSDHPGEARLAIRADESGERLAWEVTLLSDGRPVRSWIDALDGRVVVLDDGIAHAAGLVFESDPRGPLVRVPLAGLAPGSPLESSLLRVEDVLNAPAQPSPEGDFLYTSDQPEFDQVNVYHHVSHFLQDVLVGRLGMAPLAESLLVRVQFRTDPFVAFTSGRFVFLGRPITGFVHEVSRATDLIVHEATHAVLYANDIQPTSLRREAGALHEGLADYFAAMVTGDPAIGEWLYLPFPSGATRVDMPLPLWHMSNYDHVSFAGGEAASPWGNGMILSSALWDLRGRIGESADSLVLESLDLLPSAPQWGHLANALILADALHHGGRFSDDISLALSRRGIRGAIEAGIAIVGPNTVVPGSEGHFTSTACCGGLPGAYEWRARAWCRAGDCSVFEVVGTGPDLTIRPDVDLELSLRVIGPWGDTLHSAPFFVGVRMPEIMIEGPRRLPRDVPGVWWARVSALGPSRVDWTRRLRVAGSLTELLGAREEIRFAPPAPFDLTAKLTDALGRTVTQTIAVETFVPGSVPDTPRTLSSHTTFDTGAHSARTRFELPAPGRIQADLYDVRGRLRARIADAQAPRGLYFVDWDAAPLESGMYFLRLRVSGSGARTERFAVIR